MEHHDEKEVMELALQAGHLLLENGAEIFRVEETMERICRYYGVCSENEFVLSNGIFITGGNEKENYFAKVQHIPVSATQLDRVAAVNQLSREIEEGKYTLQEAFEAIERIRKMPQKSKRSQILASGIGSAAFCLLFGGALLDSMAALIAGFFLYGYILFFSGKKLSKITQNIGGGLLVTLICGLLHQMGLGIHMHYMIMGAIMPLVPGVAFTNAIRDMADGDYLSGAVRMLDALVVFVCIATGVGIGISFLNRLTGGIVL